MSLWATQVMSWSLCWATHHSYGVPSSYIPSAKSCVGLKLLRYGLQVTKKELLMVMHRKNLVEHALVPPIRTGPGIRQSHPDDAILAKMYFKQEK